MSRSVRDIRCVIAELLWGKWIHIEHLIVSRKIELSQKHVQTSAESFYRGMTIASWYRRCRICDILSDQSCHSMSDSVLHSCSSFRCVIRSVSICPPRGNLVDGLPRAPSGGKSARRFFQKYFDKNRDCSPPCGQICSKTVPVGL